MAGPPPEFVIIRRLIVELAQKEASKARRYGDGPRELYELVARQYRRMTARELELALPARGLNSVRVGMDEPFLFLPAIDSHGWMLPLLSFTFDLDSDPAQCRIYVALFHTSDRGTLEAIGFRCETPEGASGHHSFFHMQLITAMGEGGGGESLPVGCWVPTGVPAFPLDALSVVQLFAACLVSLYGPNEVLNLLRGGAMSHARSHLSGMRSLTI